MTLNRQITELIQGAHVLAETPLTAYHAAQEVKSALRKRDDALRFMAVRGALKNWRVMVSWPPGGRIRIWRPDTRGELFLG